jgi:hypothetical protein
MIVPDLNAADCNACNGTALPINLSKLECCPFPARRSTPSRREGLGRRPRAQTSRLPLARSNERPNVERQQAFATIPIVPNIPRLRSIRLL